MALSVRYMPGVGRSRTPRALGLLLATALGAPLAASQPAKPAPGETANRFGAYVSGRYRNLFAELGRPQREIAGKINATFRQLFYGDPNTQAVYFPAGRNGNGPLAYIFDVGHNDIRSEGISYGMMAAVQLDKKAEFDALWNWARTYMYHDAPGSPAKGYFSWSMKPDGTPFDEMPVAAAEEYFATALYFASGRWGNGRGIYDYRAEADRILTAMRHREMITGPTVQGIRTASDMFHPDYALVRFSPAVELQHFTDPSYHLPAFYELWARWGPVADRPFWAKAAAASREFFQRVAHPLTALTPDYATYGGPPFAAPWDSRTADFRYDAWRTAMNWSVDWAWWSADTRERDLTDKLQAFFEARGVSTYGNQFSLDGRQLGNAHSTGLVAMNGVASLAATHLTARRFVKAFWDAPIPEGQWRYYDGMLYLLGVLHASGTFRIWPPQGQPTAGGGR